MSKKHFDFVLYSYNDDERRVLRFYTKTSHVHGFGEEPPKKWEDVYKVYYSYAILSQNIWDKEWETEVLYKEEYDECSALGDLSIVLDKIIKGESDKDIYKLYPVGSGTSWNLYYHPKDTIFDTKAKWEFQLWQTYTHKGYYFLLAEDELKGLKDKIDEFLDYMLKHSEGI